MLTRLSFIILLGFFGSLLPTLNALECQSFNKKYDRLPAPGFLVVPSEFEKIECENSCFTYACVAAQDERKVIVYGGGCMHDFIDQCAASPADVSDLEKKEFVKLVGLGDEVGNYLAATCNSEAECLRNPLLKVFQKHQEMPDVPHLYGKLLTEIAVDPLKSASTVKVVPKEPTLTRPSEHRHEPIPPEENVNALISNTIVAMLANDTLSTSSIAPVAEEPKVIVLHPESTTKSSVLEVTTDGTETQSSSDSVPKKAAGSRANRLDSSTLDPKMSKGNETSDGSNSGNKSDISVWTFFCVFITGLVFAM